ncbi:arginine-glutamic acid dipeptide repeats protein-like [Forsythia ovata]|uniref:Arginine-glutamic acid dipeptide repeats protein-like n=1 Tax=Forsythia ovata TaxID=205694 RepID=A0ABD1UE44_9LAMI
MNNNTTSQFMDKQIMDLSNSQTNNKNSNDDFIDFMNRPSEDHNRRKDDIVPSYDFLPIRPTSGSTSSPPPPRSMNFDSGNDDAPIRTWNSLDSKTNSSSVRNYSSLDGIEPAKVILEKDHKAIDASLVSEIDRAMKKYADNLMHAMDGVSARLSQLETRTRNLENSVDDLKVSVGDNHGSTDGKLRQLENILREVQTGVQFIKDKQEIVEAQLQIAKLQVSKVEQQVENPSTAHTDSTQPGASAHHQSHQQLSTVPLTQPPPTLSLPNAPPPPPPQQNLPPQVQLHNQYSQNQGLSVPQRESYFHPPGQTPENPSQQYQTPPVQPQQIAPPSLPLQQQYQPPPQQHYSQLHPPQQHYSQSQQSPPPQPHSTIPPVNPSQPQQPLGHRPEETPYIQPPTYPPSIRQPVPPLSHPSSGAPPSQQFYGPPPNMYEPPSSRPNSVYSGSYDPSSGPGEPYYSGSPSQYSSGSPVKLQHHSSSMLGQSGGSGYPQLPTARILPQAPPTASGVGGGSGSTGTGNRVPVDDVVDKVTSMGFSRDQVRATVRKLTESGQSVDLNIVLDKLMNDGDVQAPRGWYGR